MAKTLRREFLNGKVFDSITDAQAQVVAWVQTYDFDCRHQGIGDVVLWERFRLAGEDHNPVVRSPAEPVGAEYCFVPGQAAFWYSLMSPSHRVDFTT